MDEYSERDDSRAAVKQKLRQYFDGRIVRKDLTKRIKEGANVPVYVLEFLLGQYCSSDDEEIVEAGVNNVKRILADNFVRPDEAQKVLSVLRERGSYTVIDKITVHLNIKEDRYEAEFSNLGHKESMTNSFFASSPLLFPIAASLAFDIGSGYACKRLPCPRKNQRQICFGELVIAPLEYSHSPGLSL